MSGAFDPTRPVKLSAQEAEDLKVMSALLQDAVGKLGDFAYIPGERRFAFVVNRFRWELADKGKARGYARVRCGVHFDGVLTVQAQNIKMGEKDAIVSLLSIAFEPGEGASDSVMLNFSGGGAIRLHVECLDAHMSDLTASWRTANKPEHEL